MRFLAAAVVGLALCAACSSPAGQSCPNDRPSTCPSPAPTFSADVSPLIQKHCAGCHSPDGAEPTRPLVDYNSITGSMDRTAGMIETQLDNCTMPPLDQPPLTQAERQAILGWIVCGAKND